MLYHKHPDTDTHNMNIYSFIKPFRNFIKSWMSFDFKQLFTPKYRCMKLRWVHSIGKTNVGLFFLYKTNTRSARHQVFFRENPNIDMSL